MKVEWVWTRFWRGTEGIDWFGILDKFTVMIEPSLNSSRLAFLSVSTSGFFIKLFPFIGDTSLEVL